MGAANFCSFVCDHYHDNDCMMWCHILQKKHSFLYFHVERVVRRLILNLANFSESIIITFLILPNTDKGSNSFFKKAITATAIGQQIFLGVFLTPPIWLSLHLQLQFLRLFRLSVSVDTQSHGYELLDLKYVYFSFQRLPQKNACARILSKTRKNGTVIRLTIGPSALDFLAFFVSWSVRLKCPDSVSTRICLAILVHITRNLASSTYYSIMKIPWLDVSAEASAGYF